MYAWPKGEDSCIQWNNAIILIPHSIIPIGKVPSKIKNFQSRVGSNRLNFGPPFHAHRAQLTPISSFSSGSSSCSLDFFDGGSDHSDSDSDTQSDSTSPVPVLYRVGYETKVYTHCPRINRSGCTFEAI